VWPLSTSLDFFNIPIWEAETFGIITTSAYTCRVESREQIKSKACIESSSHAWLEAIKAKSSQELLKVYPLLTNLENASNNVDSRQTFNFEFSFGGSPLKIGRWGFSISDGGSFVTTWSHFWGQNRSKCWPNRKTGKKEINKRQKSFLNRRRKTVFFDRRPGEPYDCVIRLILTANFIRRNFELLCFIWPYLWSGWKEPLLDLVFTIYNLLAWNVQQGCQIFLGAWYQNRKKCTKWTQNVNGYKISRMSVKYSKWP
jgi:hypothetical protein